MSNVTFCTSKARPFVILRRIQYLLLLKSIIILLTGGLNQAIGSEIIYSGFFVSEQRYGHPENHAAFINLTINGSKIIFEMDHFDENNKRTKQKVIFYQTKDTKSHFKKIIKAHNHKANPPNRGSFDFKLGKYVEFEYINNSSEIIGSFSGIGENYFFVIRTDKKIKLPKKGILFAPLNDKNDVGFYLLRNKDGYIKECIFSKFDDQYDYNGNTIIMFRNSVCKGQTKNSKFIDSYTIDTWAPCLFSGYDEVVVRWVVVLKQLDNIAPGAYGYNCSNKLARQCDLNFNNCKQLIEKEVDYSLALALGAILTGAALILDGVQSSASNLGSSSPSYKIDEEKREVNLGAWEETSIFGSWGTADPERIKIKFKCSKSDYTSKEVILGRNLEYRNKPYSTGTNVCGLGSERFGTFDEAIQAAISCTCK